MNAVTSGATVLYEQVTKGRMAGMKDGSITC